MEETPQIALIPKERLHGVCRIGQGNYCCRYITCGRYGFECEKLGPLALLLDQRVAEGKMVAIGDNCEGIAPGFLVPENKRTHNA